MKTRVCAAAGMLLALAGAAQAQISGEAATWSGLNHVINLGSEVGPRSTPEIVYDNLSTGTAANLAFSSTDLTAVWGDELNMTGAGVLQEHSFTIFNSSTSNTAAFTGGTAFIDFFEADSGTYLGGYSVNLTANLAAGFFTVFTVTGLQGFGIDLTSDVIITQSLENITGGTTRMGFVSLQPILVGDSPTSFYADASTIGGGSAGWYTSATGPVQLGTRVIIPAPGAAGVLAASGLLASRRRRR